MDTVTDTAIVDYRLSFAEQGKKTAVYHFRLQLTNGSLPFAENKWKLPFSVNSVFAADNGSCCFPLIPFCVCRRVST
jgi:hypothetical protein